MKILSRLFLLSIPMLILQSCKEETGTPITRVWYAIQVTPDYDFDVVYFSDKYFDTGTLDTIHINDSTHTPQGNNNLWIAERLTTDKSEGYFIKARFNEWTPYEGKLGMFVYANDTNLLDSVFFDFETREVELSGSIPKILN
jgi:hypothetical protein